MTAKNASLPLRSHLRASGRRSTLKPVGPILSDYLDGLRRRAARTELAAASWDTALAQVVPISDARSATEVSRPHVQAA